MKKKSLLLIMVLILSFIFVACGGKDDDSDVVTSGTPEQLTPDATKISKDITVESSSYNTDWGKFTIVYVFPKDDGKIYEKYVKKVKKNGFVNDTDYYKEDARGRYIAQNKDGTHEMWVTWGIDGDEGWLEVMCKDIAIYDAAEQKDYEERHKDD